MVIVQPTEMLRRICPRVWWALLLLMATSCQSDSGEATIDSTSSIPAAGIEDEPFATATSANVDSKTTSMAVADSTTVTLIPNLTSPASVSSPTSPPVTTAIPPQSTTTTTLDRGSTTSTTAPSTTTTSTTTLPDDLTVVEVVVREGRVVSKDRVDVVLGNRISLIFHSDTRLLVHIHGYDEEFSVEAGVLTTHEMVGDLPGIFEVEDHVTHRLLIEMKVSP